MAETVPVKKTKSVFDELSSLQEQIMRRAYEIFDGSGRLFGRDLDDWLRAEEELVWKPSVELEEKDHEFVLRMAVPGVVAKNIDIEVTPEELLVKAEIQQERKEKKGQLHISEFSSGNLFRAIRFPRKVDPDKVKAEVKNGMLLLKAEIAEAERAKKVAVQSA